MVSRMIPAVVQSSLRIREISLCATTLSSKHCRTPSGSRRSISYAVVVSLTFSTSLEIFFSLFHITSHRQNNASIALSPTAWISSAVTLSTPGDLLFFSLFIAVSTSAFSRQGVSSPSSSLTGISANTVGSVSICGLYRSKMYSFHLSYPSYHFVFILYTCLLYLMT